MKVISGKYKGRKIEGFEIDGTRPTMDRVKESLFGMLQENISDSTILDLFSGSGNLAIEALSEGAKYAYACDKNIKAVKTIKRNIESIGIADCKVLLMDYKECLKTLEQGQVKIDVIFLDPPYKTDFIEKSIILINEYNLLSKDGIIVCESDSLDKIVYPENYKVTKNRKYGDKYIVFLQKI